MPVGFSVVLILAAQATSAPQAYGPSSTAASSPQPSSPAKEAPRDCRNQVSQDPDAREIIVCAERPQGYRLDPDVLEARRLKKKGENVRPRNPHETFANHDCATVGPMGCRGQATIDIYTAATALATMAQRLASGQEIGSMFRTTPTSSEYQLYLQAKKEREEQELIKAAKAKAAAAQAAADAAQKQPQPGATTEPAR